MAIFTPPRHGKTELASRRFPAFYFGHHPNRQIIAASYNSDFATDHGRDVRNIVASPEYGEIFPDVYLRQDSKAADRWNTNQGGVYVAAGVGTATTGRGAHLGLIDDPVKDRQEADSELARERVWNWYRSTFRTRLMPGGAIVLIQTRWHEDDLAGRILNSEGAAEWEVLDLPAISDEPNWSGALWPEWYDEGELLKIKRDVGHREWSALYQQRPAPDEGTFYQREWFRRHRETPGHVNVFMTSDYAVTDEGGDFTEHGVWGLSETGIYQLDWWYGQTAADEWIERGLDLVQKWKPFCWFGEAGVIRKAVEPFLIRRMRERKAHCRVEWLPSVHDKPTRARSFQAKAALGEVSLLADERGDRLLDQLLKFPAGKHDDAVDVCSVLGQAIDQAHPAIQVANIPKPKVDRWDKVFGSSGNEGKGWKTV